jgi:hypothetical protein
LGPDGDFALDILNLEHFKLRSVFNPRKHPKPVILSAAKNLDIRATVAMKHSLDSSLRSE